ncbi:MAG TPA: LytTR family DNA-binding domain-containing protein [Candidatus Dormibacteraeota bacterium]|nr:LytTR family DNA-binding domain-containing protein [Candidatus Dormibacteraeota bacterium]
MATSMPEGPKAVECEKVLQQVVHPKAGVSASAHENTIATIKKNPDCALAFAAEKQIPESMDVIFDRTVRLDGAKRTGVLQQLEILEERRSSRIAFKAKGRIYFVELADIIAVQAEGNYVALQHQSKLYLLRESLSSIAEKLKPYGFVRIHRSVLVNASVVEEIQPLVTGEYRLRVKGGKEYMVTRTYKDNLRFLAHLWLGSEGLLS